jgi:PKD repeat protein
MATPDVAPNLQGPKASAAEFTPTLTSPAGGQVRVAWTADFDYDNSNLVYTILRDGQTTPLTTIRQASTWWQRPAMTFTDTGVPAGAHSYRVRVVDPFGNNHTSPSVSITVAQVGNASPLAAFTVTVSGRTATVDGTGSTDSDGTIAGYAWNWGDGQTDTGATASHTYAADGTYTVALTVTDNAGATGTTSKAVVVGSVPAVLASDSFGRTVTSGFGTADTGGAWTTNGSGFAVNGGQGVVTVSTAGAGPWAQLGGVSSTAVDLVASVQLDKLVNSGATYFGTIGRRAGSSDYRLKVKVDTAGGITVYAIRSSGGETTLTSASVPVTYAPRATLNTRLQVTGTAPTTIRARVWLSTAAEPTTWQISATDSTAGLQSAGSVGLFTYIALASTNSPWVFRFDNFVAKPPA